MAASTSKKRIFNEINITPLTDIFLVLLIIMMVVAPLMQSVNNEIKPPSIESGQAVEPSRLTVEVDTDGNYFLEGQPVQLDSLAENLKALADEAELKPEDRNVIVRADQKTLSAAVIRVFEAAQDAEFHKVTVAGQKPEADVKSQLQGESAPSAFESDFPASDTEEPWN